MNRTELVTEILKLTGHKRSLHPKVHFGINRLLDKYDKFVCSKVDFDGKITSLEKHYKDGEPCSHSCLHHASHPCERCGRIGAKGEAIILNF